MAPYLLELSSSAPAHTTRGGVVAAHSCLTYNAHSMLQPLSQRQRASLLTSLTSIHHSSIIHLSPLPRQYTPFFRDTPSVPTRCPRDGKTAACVYGFSQPIPTRSKCIWSFLSHPPNPMPIVHYPPRLFLPRSRLAQRRHLGRLRNTVGSEPRFASMLPVP